MNDFQLAIKMNPSNGFFYLNRAVVYGMLDNYAVRKIRKKNEALKEAIEDLNFAIGNLKDNLPLFKAYFHRGNCLRHMKKYEASIADLSKVISFIQSNLLFLGL